MLPGRSLNYTNFKIGVFISLLFAASIIGMSFYLGKDNFFLLLNTDLGIVADYFFEYFTYMGDGILWIVWLAIVLSKKRRRLLPLIISSLILTTIFTQVFKYVIVPDEARPSTAIVDVSQIHFVQGVTVHATSSFPSGHTATAFTFVLLIALTMTRKGWMFLAIVVALLVGYSRVYLGQHFPLDVGGGIVVAICSVSLSILVHQYFDRKRLKQL